MTKHIYFVFLLIISINCIASDDAIHIVSADHSEFKILSKLTMQSRLIDAAKKYEKLGHVDRATLFDCAFPVNREEYIQMNGFGVLWVTSHSHVKEELPIKNLRVSIARQSALVLPEISVYLSEEQDVLVARVLGKYRSDSVYLVPLFDATRGANLTADYSINRTDFIFGKIDEDFQSDIGPAIKMPAEIRYPEKNVFLTMLNREYPVFEELKLNSDKYSQQPLARDDFSIEKRLNDQPFNSFRFIGNALVCKSQTPDSSACLQIGTLKIGDAYQFKDSPVPDIPLPKGDTASAFPIIRNETQHAYWVIGHMDGKITSVQLTGNYSDPKLNFSSILLGDTEEKVRTLLGTRFTTTPVEDIKGIEWNYYPFAFSLQFVDGKVYSMRVFDAAFCNSCVPGS